MNRAVPDRELEALMADDDFPWRSPAGGSWIVFVADFREFAEKTLGGPVAEARLDEFVRSLGGQRRAMFDARGFVRRLLRRSVERPREDLYEVPPPLFLRRS